MGENMKIQNKVLMKSNINLGLTSESQDDAINRVGAMLVQSGYVKPEYVDAMFAREEVVSTYIGNGIAIPHGVGGSQQFINSSGIVVCQYPEGIQYNGNTCYLVIGICGLGNDHIKILSNIAEVLMDEEDAREFWMWAVVLGTISLDWKGRVLSVLVLI